MSHWQAGASPAPDTTHVALIQATALAQLRADLAAAQADAAHWRQAAATWRQRVMDTRELIALVEDLSEDPSPATVGALVNHFTMWRALVEADVPVTWAVAGVEPGEPDPLADWPDAATARALGAATEPPF